MTIAKSGNIAAMEYAERDNRINEAIAMKVPDRVPIQLFVGYFAAKYCGIPCSSAYYDPEQWRAANIRTITELEPDVYWAQTATVSGKALEILGPLQIRWPGFGVSPNHSHQMIELEPMKAEDYDAFLGDPSDFIVRTYLPRVLESAAPMAKLPPFQSLMFSTGMAPYLAIFTRPDMAAMLEKFRKAGELQAEWQNRDINFNEAMAEHGFPSYNTPRMMGSSPFDTISDFLRGMRGSMLDMYRIPDKLLEACDMLCKQTTNMIKAFPAPEDGSVKRVFLALHRGSDGFMSLPQFEKFYWPNLKKVLLALIDAGWTPCPFFEGTWDQRLEYLLELPKGKVLCHFAKTDPENAKAILGGHLCFMIDVPGFILQAGTISEVEDYCKKLIRVCGKDGGFIMTATALDEARPENVKAMIDITKSCGRYS
jgi:Uroporphyrinogen decarboxylase (URO-D)